MALGWTGLGRVVGVSCVSVWDGCVGVQCAVCGMAILLFIIIIIVVVIVDVRGGRGRPLERRVWVGVSVCLVYLVVYSSPTWHISAMKSGHAAVQLKPPLHALDRILIFVIIYYRPMESDRLSIKSDNTLN
jgi:hypothetical protein